jgi:hypothetical protein
MVLFAALIGAGGWSPPRFGVVEVPPNPIVLQMVRLKTDASEPSWVVTDNPMDAYRAHVLVPPELAVITAKRLRQGFLTTDSFKALIEEAKPSQVMFRNFVFDGEILEYLGRSPSYRRVAWSSETHFVRTDLIAGGANPFPPPPVWPTPR